METHLWHNEETVILSDKSKWRLAYSIMKKQSHCLKSYYCKITIPLVDIAQILFMFAQL